MESKSGTIRKIIFKRRYGFIRPDNGAADGTNDLFFHMNGVITPAFEELREGHPVEFYIVSDGDKQGRPRAIGIVVV